MDEVDVLSFAKEWRGQSRPFLLDVREPDEADFCRIEGSTLIPLGALPHRLQDLPRDFPIVVYCHRGGRSARAVQLLKECGFGDVRNLKGGIEAWSVSVDRSVPRY